MAVKIHAAARLLSSPKDVSKWFSYVPDLKSALVGKHGTGYQIIVTTGTKPSKEVWSRMNRTIDVAAKELGLRVREMGTEQRGKLWIKDFVLDE